jgi:hypothetical protein
VFIHSGAQHGAEPTWPDYACGDRYGGSCSGCRAESVAESGANGKPEADAGTDTRTKSEPDCDTGSGADSNADTDAEPNANSNAWRADAQSDSRCEPESQCEPDSNANAYSNPHPANVVSKLNHKGTKALSNQLVSL